MLAPDVRRRAERRVGTTLCRKWRLDSVVGCGGMATVYAATHRNRNRVAVKILHPELSIDDQIRAKFLREGYLANTIGHAGAVAVLDDDEAEDGTAFLVMELLQGETLDQRLERCGGRLSRKEALHTTEQVLEILGAAHAKGIVHRDIKPENLFITRSGQLKVLDFGIARISLALSGSTGLGTFYGTPGYAPPEQARGRSDDVDARSDLYAVAATLFAMLTGRAVHEAETATERLALTISLPAPSITTVSPDLPIELSELIDRALRYDRAERWPDAATMLEAVRAAQAAVAWLPDDDEPEFDAEAPTLAQSTTPELRATEGSIRSVTTSTAGAAGRRTRRRIVPLFVVGLGLLVGVRSLVHVESTPSVTGSVASPAVTTDTVVQGLRGSTPSAAERRSADSRVASPATPPPSAPAAPATAPDGSAAAAATAAQSASATPRVRVAVASETKVLVKPSSKQSVKPSTPESLFSRRR